MGNKDNNPDKNTTGRLPPVLENIRGIKTKTDRLAPKQMRVQFRSRLNRILIGKSSIALRLKVAAASIQYSILRAVSTEREAGVLFHFAPLFFGFGIVVYFTVSSEPVLFALVSTCLILSAAALAMKRHGALWMMICSLALFFAGMSAGKIRTDLINTHPLQGQITANIAGTIVEVTQNRRGAPRYLILTQAIEGLERRELPKYVRLSSTSSHEPGKPGERITGLARLRSFSGPAYPGGFDFSFNAWYDGLGGSGFFMGKPEIRPLTPANQLNWSTRFVIAINQLRLNIAARIRSALPGENGDVAVALIIGDRTGIDTGTQESLRKSGLAHVLAISGMHMALVSLTMVWSVRFLLALNMGLALRHPIKNWAAIAGFGTAGSYLLISGMSLATQRAWIMISIMILAVIVNRKSITLRGVALAAMAILIVQPESILSPGFQMSFAAVAAIVAAYEWLDERKAKNFDRPRANRVLRFFGTLIFTSLIAGLATSLFAAYHFHRVAPLGVLTNLMAMPLVSIVIMPSALLSVLAMPYGLENIAFAPMGAGIDQVIAISNYVNSLGGNGVTGHLGAPVLPLAFAGMFLLTMLKTFLRIGGLLLLMATGFFWQGSKVPDILLSEDGRAIAIKTTSSQLALMYPRRNKFIRDIWLRAFSNDQAGNFGRQNISANSSAATDLCNKNICTATTLQGARVYVVYDPKLLEEACNAADILLAPRLRWVNCYERQPALVIKRGQLEEFGSHAIYLDIMTNADKARALVESGKLKNSARIPSRPIKKIQLKLEDVLNAQIPETGAANQSTIAVNPHPLKSPAQPTINSPANIPAPQILRNFKIEKVTTSIENTIRPWNRHREGRAAFRQD